MDKLLSSLDNLEKDITDFLNRKTKFGSLRFVGEKTDENLNMVINSTKHKSLDVTSSRELPQVAHRHSDYLRTHEGRRKAQTKRQGVLFPCDLDIIKAGRTITQEEEKANMERVETTPAVAQKGVKTNSNYHLSDIKEGDNTAYSNVILEMRNRSDKGESTMRSRYELHVQVVNGMDSSGVVDSTKNKIIQDLSLPVPEDLNTDAEESWYNIFKTLCKINGPSISEELVNIEESADHHIINEYFV